jgi:hypothetical protein
MQSERRQLIAALRDYFVSVAPASDRVRVHSGVTAEALLEKAFENYEAALHREWFEKQAERSSFA